MVFGIKLIIVRSFKNELFTTGHLIIIKGSEGNLKHSVVLAAKLRRVFLKFSNLSVAKTETGNLS